LKILGRYLFTRHRLEKLNLKYKNGIKNEGVVKKLLKILGSYLPSRHRLETLSVKDKKRIQNG